MYYRLLEAKTKIDSKYTIKNEDNLKEILDIQTSIVKDFMDLTDSKVKLIYDNQEEIKANLTNLFKANDTIIKTTKEVDKTYDEFLEHLKEAGDLFNYSNIIEKDMDLIYNKIITKNKSSNECYKSEI